MPVVNTTFVSRPRDGAMTPEREELARKLIQSGYSSTQVFRALGQRSANVVIKWARANGLGEKLADNGMARKKAMGRLLSKERK
jgi:hypothetical protein